MTTPPPERRRLPRRALIVAGVALVAATAGVAWLRSPKASVTTENAYFKSDRTILAPRVKGQVAQVLVTDNQRVRAGDVLVRLEPEEYAARLASARGDVAAARAAIAAAQGAMVRLDAEQGLAADTIAEARTAIAASDAQASRARADLARYDALVADGTVARRDAERVRAEALSTAANADHSRAALKVSQGQAAVTASRGQELSASLAAARAQYEKAQAALGLAQLDLDHATIRAPISGIVADRQANPGDYVAPGTRLMTVVPTTTLYVTANFKETQTDRMLAGQAATITADALPGRKFTARVQSLAPGSGSEFALLPFEPGSGNFTKIVQRVPVRLALDPGQADVVRLRPGLSAKVTVRLR